MTAGANQTANNQEGSPAGNGAPNGISVPDDSVVGTTLVSPFNELPMSNPSWRSCLQLKDKTIRDVALRCRWVNKKENVKRRKEDNNSAKKIKTKRKKLQIRRRNHLPMLHTVPMALHMLNL